MRIAWEIILGMLVKHAPFAYTLLLNNEIWKTHDHLSQNKKHLVMQVTHLLVPQLAQVVCVMNRGSNKFSLQLV
jgi:hypothetical protein